MDDALDRTIDRQVNNAPAMGCTSAAGVSTHGDRSSAALLFRSGWPAMPKQRW
jgi:hypothetical protein